MLLRWEMDDPLRVAPVLIPCEQHPTHARSAASMYDCAVFGNISRTILAIPAAHLAEFVHCVDERVGSGLGDVAPVCTESSSVTWIVT